MSVAAPEQMAATGMVAAPEAAEGFVAVEAGVEGVKVAVKGVDAATAIVGAGEGVVVGAEVSPGMAVESGAGTGKAAELPCPPPMLPAPADSVTVATKPAACTESSAKNCRLSKGPVDTIGCGNVGPENVPRRLLPSYTYTLS